MKKTILSFFALLLSMMVLADTPKVVLDFTTDDEWGIGGSSKAKNTTDASFTNNDEYTITILVENLPAGTDGAPITGAYYYDGSKKNLLYGEKFAAMQLPTFDFKVARIVVDAQGAPTAVRYDILSDHTDANTSLTDGSVKGPALHTFTIQEDYQAAGTTYYLTATTKANMRVSKIEIYEVVEGAPEAVTFGTEGATFVTPQDIELFCETAGAKIYYTLDGSEPTESSNLYQGAVTISTTATLRAIAVVNGIASPVTEQTYRIVDVPRLGTEEDPFIPADILTIGEGLAGKYWVKGVVIGSYPKNAPDTEVDTVASNIAIAIGTDTIPVELKSGSNARTALNIKDNPSIKGQTVAVYGNIEAYKKTIGVKNVTKYAILGNDASALIETIREAQAGKKIMLGGQVYILHDGELYELNGTRVE